MSTSFPMSIQLM